MKIALGVAKGKKMYDKRQAIKQKDLDRDTERTMAKHNKLN